MSARAMDESASFDVVIPAKAGIQWRYRTKTLGPRLRGDDDQLHRSIDAFLEA